MIAGFLGDGRKEVKRMLTKPLLYQVVLFSALRSISAGAPHPYLARHSRGSGFLFHDPTSKPAFQGTLKPLHMLHLWDVSTFSHFSHVYTFEKFLHFSHMCTSEKLLHFHMFHICTPLRSCYIFRCGYLFYMLQHFVGIGLCRSRGVCHGFPKPVEAYASTACMAKSPCFEWYHSQPCLARTIKEDAFSGVGLRQLPIWRCQDFKC